MRRLTLAAALLSTGLACAPARAQQTLYKQTEDGWFIYKEDKSCALYSDFETGTMLRFSYRSDESRIYFSAFNKAWEMMRPRLGESVMLFLEFPRIKQVHGSAGIVLANLDGRLGFTGDAFGLEEIPRALANEGGMVLKVLWKDGGDAVEIDSFGTDGGAMAVEHLIDCSRQHFAATK